MFALRLPIIAAVLALGAVADSSVDLQRRDAVANCRLVLIALKASAFCSSFVPIVDVTSTSMNAGTFATTTVAGNPCTTTAPAITTTATSIETSTVTSTVTSTTTTAVYARKAKRAKIIRAKRVPATTTTAVAAAATTKYAIKGLSVKLSLFACDVIKQACLLYVKPKTIKATVAGPTSTTTSTAAAVCETTTPIMTTTQVSSTVITTTTTSVVTMTTTLARQPFFACNNAPGPNANPRPNTGDINQYFCSNIPGFCICAADPGQTNGGAGKCRYSYYPQLRCTTDSDCAGNSRCLGQAKLDGSGSPLSYYCSNTAFCF